MADSIEQLYDEHAQALYGFLLNVTRSEEDTRDLLQEIFIKIVRRPLLLKGVSNVRGFLFRLAHNAAVDHIRRNRTREKYADRLSRNPQPILAASQNPDESTFRDALAEGLALLGPEQRAVVHLKLWEGFTFEVIAETLDIPLNTAASRYRYGLDKLRQHLRPLYDEIQRA